MRKLFISFIGSVVILSGMHAMPARAMEHDEIVSMMCSSCPDDNHMDDDCNERADQKHPAGYGSPSHGDGGDDCDCYFESHAGDHHNAVIRSASQPLKLKSPAISHSLFTREQWNFTRAFLPDLNIHAPPAAYIASIGSVRQLK